MASGGCHDGRGGRGGSKDLMQEKSEKRYVMIEVRPEGYRDGLGLDIQRIGNWLHRCGNEFFIKYETFKIP